MTPEQVKSVLLQRGYNFESVKRYIAWTVLVFRKSYFQSFELEDELIGDYQGWLASHPQPQAQP